jgi:hypothetical protein
LLLLLLLLRLRMRLFGPFLMIRLFTDPFIATAQGRPACPTVIERCPLVRPRGAAITA